MRSTNLKASPQNPDKMMFRISKHAQPLINKPSSSTRQKENSQHRDGHSNNNSQIQAEQRPEKNHVLQEYKYFMESLQKAGPSPSLADHGYSQISK